MIIAVVGRLSADPLPLGQQTLQFGFSFTQGGWGDVHGTMVADVFDAGAGAQIVAPLHTSWTFYNPDLNQTVSTSMDSYPGFSSLLYNNGSVSGYLNLIVYDPNIHWPGTLNPGDIADFHHSLKWNYSGFNQLAGGWMTEMGDPQINLPVYSHTEYGMLPMQLALKTPDEGSSLALLCVAGLAIAAFRRSRSRR